MTTTTPTDADRTRPLALGYLRAHILMKEHELDAVKRDLSDFAAREGFTLGAIFVERLDRSPAAFQALMAEARRTEAAAVVVPGVHHLSVLGAPQAFRDHMEHHTNARVLCARASP